MTAATRSPFEYGQQHYRDGLPRASNPFLCAAFSNGAHRPDRRPSVVQWFLGWDMAKIEADAAIAKAQPTTTEQA